MTVLNSYPAYKPSGVEWLGDVPAHWEVRRLKQICRLVYGNALDADARQASVVPVFGSNGGVGLHNSANTKAPCIVIGRKGSFGKVNFSHCPVFAIDTTFYIDGRFSSADIRWLFFLLGTLGLDDVTKDSAIPGLDREDVYQRVAALPPLPEQTAIVRFLDHADRRIRRYILAKQKMIALLEEQKQTLIHQAVTGQIDVCTGEPYPVYKPSGVEWLGDVPAHWEESRVKQISRIQGGFAFSSDIFGDVGVPVVRMHNIHRGVLRLDNVVRVPEFQCKEAFALKEGDIVYGLSGSIGETGSLGNYAIVRRSDLPAQLNQRVARLQPSVDLLADSFLVRSLQTNTFYEQVLAHTSGTAQFNVSTKDIGNVYISLPPVDEQQQIVQHLSRAAANIDTNIARANRQINLLREYRTRLIADVVTGKLDVRDAAAALPEADPLAAEDDLNDTFDTEVEPDLDELVTTLEEAEA